MKPGVRIFLTAIFLSLPSLLLVTSLHAAPPEIRLVDVTKEAGLLEPLAGIMGHGGAFGDIDADGDLDIFIGGFCDRPNESYKPASRPVPNVLLENRGDGTFLPVEKSPVVFYGRTSGALFADLDNNGTQDLYVANNCKGKSGHKIEPQRTAQLQNVSLFRNDQGKFFDISRSSGACPESFRTARNIGVFDYDGDGRLDLLVLGDRFTRSPRSVLFHNEGKLRFKDVNREVGLPDDIFGLGLAVADINEDGRADFFVAHSNRLFLSAPGGKFRECVELEQVFGWKPMDNEDWPCGAAFGDLNRDGRLDLVLSIHFEKARNKLFLNRGLDNGIPQFQDVTREVGFPAEVPQKCPHVEIQDFDNDGWPDIYMSAAWLDGQGRVTPLVFRHQGLSGRVPKFQPPRPLTGPMVYYPAGPTGDYDGDGRVDILLINWFEGNWTRLLHNESPQQHWLDVAVVGKTFNRMGIGTQVKVYRAGKLNQPADLLGFSEITVGYGYASGQEAVCHFGLGSEAKVDLAIKLPDGKQVAMRDVQVDRRLLVKEP